MKKFRDIKYVQLLFTDIFGNLKSTEMPYERFEKVKEEGIPFDGSSIQGFARIHESDMYVQPDLSTLTVLPYEEKTAKVFCDIKTTNGKPFEGDPRYILKRTLKKAKEMGFNSFKVGPEIEFYLLKRTESSFEPEPQDKGSYFDLNPRDAGSRTRKTIVTTLNSIGIDVEMSHHEVGSGQHEIDLRYGDALKIADSIMISKYLLRIITQKNAFDVSFMPKPFYGKPGSGMHTHQSLWKNGNAFSDEDDGYGLSEIAYHFLGGQLKHIKALTAITNPTVNSFKRLVSGFEAPVNICWGRYNRSALIRVPDFQKNEGARLELRSPDSSCNPYLAFAVMLESGLDGIKNKIKPPKPIEENVYEFDERKLAKFYIDKVPDSLDHALDELGKDNIIKNALCKHIYEKFVEGKRNEWLEYRTVITNWEREKYLFI